MSKHNVHFLDEPGCYEIEAAAHECPWCVAAIHYANFQEVGDCLFVCLGVGDENVKGVFYVGSSGGRKYVLCQPFTPTGARQFLAAVDASEFGACIHAEQVARHEALSIH